MCPITRRSFALAQEQKQRNGRKKEPFAFHNDRAKLFSDSFMLVIKSYCNSICFFFPHTMHGVERGPLSLVRIIEELLE
jgi:hypothetical protein